MELGLTVVLVVFIICVTILVAMYVYYCNEREVGIFQNPKYDQRIRELEAKVKELEEKG